jgi:hypothetical protein
MLSAIALAAALSTSTPAVADEASVAAAVKLIEASRGDALFENMNAPLESMVAQTAQQFEGCDSAKATVEGFSKAMGELKLKDEQLKSLKTEMAKVYADVFTAEELKAMTEFYLSPVGQKMLDKTAEISQRTAVAMQEQTRSQQERYAQITGEYGPKLQEAYNACPKPQAPAQ